MARIDIASILLIVMLICASFSEARNIQKNEMRAPLMDTLIFRALPKDSFPLSSDDNAIFNNRRLCVTSLEHNRILESVPSPGMGH